MQIIAGYRALADALLLMQSRAKTKGVRRDKLGEPEYRRPVPAVILRAIAHGRLAGGPAQVGIR